MAKARRSDESPHQRRPSSQAPPFVNQQAFPPDPPRRHPWFLAFSALTVALWLLFLLWMAVST
ncbi:MAG: hypothetical protein ACREHD_32700 [Pirellulales bacterium]